MINFRLLSEKLYRLNNLECENQLNVINTWAKLNNMTQTCTSSYSREHKTAGEHNYTNLHLFLLMHEQVPRVASSPLLQRSSIYKRENLLRILTE